MESPWSRSSKYIRWLLLIKTFNEISKPTVYCRYVDDTFSLFHKETEFQKF